MVSRTAVWLTYAAVGGTNRPPEQPDWLPELVIRDSGCLLCDWDGIMERDNHQEGEAEGVKICDPPSESNPTC
ncbi:hypothetical protein E3U43_004110 [Larimichthys crocea]|uniref:Uncharacterized protein n=1 Tax=Larimichthys crocea TaxID=215358 RepID=A0ACD3RM60_LARCR|nr:hypothetical protein E3U43_004110 [Larimichthys crocea]